MNLKSLTNLSCPGVWAFVNESDKKIFISYSENILSAVSRNISELLSASHSCRSLVSDFSKLDLLVLEKVSKAETKVKAGRYKENYKADGWQLYNTSIPVQYSVKTTISNDCKIQVYLINRRKDKIVVGVFDSKQESDQFIQTHYPNNIVTSIVYSQNSLSKEFFRKSR